MSEFVFEIEYTDQRSGEKRLQTVEHYELARRVAKCLAMASGKRAIIRRKRTGLDPADWSVYLVDLQNGSVDLAWEGITKRQVLSRWHRWDERRARAVLIAWPVSSETAD